ncbi:MAG: polysaccharide pyruvyl transferase family protein [Oscillospiraceae bacterium]|nr:polysaccharide pyruvyl transferase family protein [Oscillospiraceae bacterium]
MESDNKYYDVGVVGWWYNSNYGGTLTYYALHQALKSMGLSVLMIEKSSSDADYKPDYSQIPRRFAKKYYDISDIYHPYKMGALNNICDSFISGSDQLFSSALWKYSGPNYFLDFAHPLKNMISYASSFGECFNGNPAFHQKISYYLRRFNSLSVRENYAVDIMKNNFGLEAVNVLDPVFICDVTEYDKLIEKSTVKINNDYFCSFILDPNEAKRNVIIYLKEKLHLPYTNLIHATDFEIKMKQLNLDNIKPDIDIEDFLAYYKNANFIITDSFHGTCFAIIFRKPFISIANKTRGVKRFESLLKTVGLENRLVYDCNEIYKKTELFSSIDYDKVYEKISEIKDFSYNWLRNAVLNPPKKTARDFNVLDAKLYDTIMANYKLMDVVDKQNEEIKLLKSKLSYNYNGKKMQNLIKKLFFKTKCKKEV